MLQNILETLFAAGARASRRRGRAGVSLALESLEQRAVPAVAAITAPPTDPSAPPKVVTMTADDNGDVLTAATEADPAGGKPNVHFKITTKPDASGKVTLLAEAIWKKYQVSGIVANGGAGDDQITFTITTGGMATSGGGQLVDGTQALTANGFGGKDTIVNNSTFGMTADGGDNNDFLQGSDVAGDNLTGGAGDDVLIGLGGSDTLVGLGGNDVLRGGVGDDTLQGGDGNDLLEGGDGKDTLEGGKGQDALIAGTINGVTSATDRLDKYMAAWTNLPATLQFQAPTVTQAAQILDARVKALSGIMTVTDDSQTDTLYGNAKGFASAATEHDAFWGATAAVGSIQKDAINWAISDYVNGLKQTTAAS